MFLTLFDILEKITDKNVIFVLAGVIAILLSIIVVILVTKHSSKTSAELRELDYLTKIYNRSYYYKKCKIFLSGKTAKYVMIAFDINKFKLINEYYGTEEADGLLKKISERLISFYTSGQIYVFGRIESDKFSWIMSNDKQKIDKVFDSLNKIKEEYNHSLSFTMGVYAIEDNNMSIEQAYSRANIAAKSIKGSFDQNIQYFNDKMIKNLDSEQFILNNLDDAITDNEILVYFQPKYDLQGNKISGAEALVRWKNKERGMISPGEFVPALENNGLITKLDKYIWDRTARYLAEWRNKGYNPSPVSINISKVDLLENDLPEYLEGIVRKYQIPHNLLQLEITESAYVDGSIDVTSILKSFKNKGFTILMDDFGSGYSSLNTLRQFPIDILKIDLKFLTGFNDSVESEKGKTIIESIVTMAKHLNLGIVVEGTETVEQVEYCKNIGCEVAQGYFFSKPVPADEYLRMVKESKSMLNEKMMLSSLTDDSIWNKNIITEDFFNNTNGALGCFLYRRDNLEAVRLNEKYFELIETVRKDFYAISRNLLDSVYPQDLDNVIYNINQCIASKDIVEFEYRRLNDTTGKIKWIKCKLTYINSEDRSTNYFFASLDDVTEIHKLNNDLESFLNNLEFAACKFDIKTGNTLLYNERLLKLLGLTKDEFDFNYKNNFRRLISNDSLESFNCAVSTRDESKRIEISVKTRDGYAPVVCIIRNIEYGNESYSYLNFIKM